MQVAGDAAALGLNGAGTEVAEEKADRARRGVFLTALAGKLLARGLVVLGLVGLPES